MFLHLTLGGEELLFHKALEVVVAIVEQVRLVLIDMRAYRLDHHTLALLLAVKVKHLLANTKPVFKCCFHNALFFFWSAFGLKITRRMYLNGTFFI